MNQSLFLFFQEYLADLHIQVRTMEKKSFSLSCLDLGLRNSILKQMSEPSAPAFAMPRSQCLYHIVDYYLCHYTFFLLEDEASLLFVGPYCTQNLEDSDIRSLMNQLQIPEELFPQLRNYYNALPLLQDKHFFDTFLQRSYCNIFHVSDVKSQFFNLRSFESTEEFLQTHEFVVPKDPVLSMHLLEERYHLEDDLLDAVASGNSTKALAAAEFISKIRLTPRSDDALRNAKNIYIVLNTLLRRSAYLSGVHPLYIDEVSSNYARMIEQCNSKEELLDFAPYMIEKYCRLVKNKSLSSYSKAVQQILVTIDASLTGDLSLKRFANDLFLNPSYLSALFKREVGTTLTDYVNQSRIHYAQKLLKSTTLSIQDISAKSGISDVHYFARLFRKETGMTPREFRNSL